MAQREVPPDFTIVIFGAGGDLTRRLIVPALYNLARSSMLPEHFALIGVDRNEKSNKAWRDSLHASLEESVAAAGESQARSIDETCWAKVVARLAYIQGDLLQPGTYERIAACIGDGEREAKLAPNVVFYLAIPDSLFGPVVRRLGEAELLNPNIGGARRVIVEKPFGHDLESARRLNGCLREWLNEDQIYRIDHFLGKETVQNIMALRFANGLFEPMWNRDRIDHVQVTVAETLGVEGRGPFYEATGALRDMVPNHLFQLVAMTAMEPPVSFDADAIRSKKAELFDAVRPLSVEDSVRGQYDVGAIDGTHVAAYRTERNVATNSNAETFVALRLTIDNWRWAGVPFYLRTGKRLAKRSTEIAIRFKRAPHAIFRQTGVDELDADWLILKIQPDEGIRLRFNAKRPGPAVALESVAMDFHYKDWFSQPLAVGYETLIYDCLIGDATLFQRADQIEAAWRVVDPLLKGWAASPPRHFPNYESGSEGPEGANELLAHDGRSWRAIR